MKKDFDIEVKWFGQAATQEVLNASMKALKQAGFAVASEARRKAPVLSGTLRRSICVSEGNLPDLEQTYEKARTEKLNEENASGNSREIAVYISANTPYAHKQHEENREKSKFLEKALQENSGKVEKYVKQELKKL